MRTAEIKRKTKETDIEVFVKLDGEGKVSVNTGIGFFDHMLTALGVHSGIDMDVECTGDLYVDGHHTVEDVGICLGKAFAEALGDKAGIARYGTCLTEEFFRAFAFNSGITLHIREEYGKNDHHIAEAMYKAVAHALKDAVKITGTGVLSTKGVL